MEHRSSDYVSGDDYVVEFLDYRYGFSRFDFEERVTAAAARLQLVPQRELQPVRDGRSGHSGSHRDGRATAQRLGDIPGGTPGRDRPAAPRNGELLAAQTASSVGRGWTIASKPACSM